MMDDFNMMMMGGMGMLGGVGVGNNVVVGVMFGMDNMFLEMQVMM